MSERSVAHPFMNMKKGSESLLRGFLAGQCRADICRVPLCDVDRTLPLTGTTKPSRAIRSWAEVPGVVASCAELQAPLQVSAPVITGAYRRAVADILIIDDEASGRSLFRQVLEPAGYGVMEASSAKKGLALLRECPVDLVLTDILMPEMDGLELTLALRRDFPHVKIIAVSCWQHEIDYCSVARLFGAHEALMKPITGQRLLDTVAKLLG